MKYSLMLTTVREFKDIKPIFEVSDKNAEIVIIDPKYKEETKKQIEKVEHDFCKVTYAPKYGTENKLDEFSFYDYKNDKMRCHNTGLGYCEGEWIFKLDDCTELCPDFFRLLDEDIQNFTWQNKNTNFVLRPVKLESWMGHKKWDDLPSLKQYKERFFLLNNQTYFQTLDQFIATKESFNLINGMDERMDVGHGHDDIDLMERYKTLGYNIILDSELKTFQTGHKRRCDPIPFAKWLYEMEISEIRNGRYMAFNQFQIRDLRKQLLKRKSEYIIKKKNNNLNKAHFVGGYPFEKYFSIKEISDNRRKINDLKDIYKDGDIFLLGNSRTITLDFINKIRNKISFAANGFIACRDHWDFEPTYFTVTDPGVFDPHMSYVKPEFTIDGEQLNNKSEYDILIKAKRANFVLSDLILKPLLYYNFHREKDRLLWLKSNTHIRVLNKEELQPPYMFMTPPNYNDLCFNLHKGTFVCGTCITDIMIPLAVWMGAKNIYLKGLSGGPGKFFTTHEKHFWDEKYQYQIYKYTYSLFKRKLDELGVNIYNLDTPDDPVVQGQWTLGDDKYHIQHKKIDEIL